MTASHMLMEFRVPKMLNNILFLDLGNFYLRVQSTGANQRNYNELIYVNDWEFNMIDSDYFMKY